MSDEYSEYVPYVLTQEQADAMMTCDGCGIQASSLTMHWGFDWLLCSKCMEAAPDDEDKP